MARALILALVCWICGWTGVHAQVTQPLVAVHDSELTRALENVTATFPTPTNVPPNTGKEWWISDWHYFVMPESLKEALKSDGTAYTVVGDSNITAGILVTNGQPRYPIVISLASEAIRDDEIAPFTNYVAAGGFLFVGSSAFTRNTNGTTRGDFAFGTQMGLHMVSGTLQNWSQNSYVTKLLDHRIDAHLPTGQLTWLMPTYSDEIPWGNSPSHVYTRTHDVWKVAASDATVLAQGDTGNNYPFLTVKPYGKGYFIYCAELQPLIGHTGFAPSTHAYVIFRRAIEWAFENLSMPIPKLSPWPYQYDAAYMVRHDLENFTNEIAAISASAQFEFTNGARGDYYFCTGTLRDDAQPGGYNTNSIVLSLKQAITNYGATLGPHNGGLKHPTNTALVRGQYDYWHWGTDEALDTIPPGYPSGKAYALSSVSNAFKDIESWASGTPNASGFRTWVQCYFNGTREDSYDLQAQLGVNIAGDQKISPFPHWTLSTLTPNKRYSYLSEPVSDWFVGGLVAQSLEPWHPPGVQTSQTMHAAVDFYYSLGALINFYSHTLSTGLGDAGALVPDYVTYCGNTNLHPRTWPANAVLVYQWWLQRSNVQVSATYSTNGTQTLVNLLISGSVSTNTAVELLTPGTNNGVCSIQVLTNGVLAGTNVYRVVNGQIIRINVGTSVTNATVSYFLSTAFSQVFAENFDGVSPPALPSGWTTSATGAQSNWATQAGTNDTPPNAVFSPDPPNSGISEIISPSMNMASGAALLSFRHYFDLENGTTYGYDGGVLEIKIGTNAFTDILNAGGSFISNGYVTTLSPTNGNPLAGRLAWSGNSGGFIQTMVSLPASASGNSVQFKWRCAADTNNGAGGWWIDSIAVSNRQCLCCATSNSPPSFTNTPPNVIMAEQTSLTVTNGATDPDGNLLFYSLNNPPAGASISSSGVISWTPSEAQGPGVYAITSVVTDSGFPFASATNSFTVTVNEVNQPPSFVSTPTNRTINELVLMTVTNTATDPDIPANPLTYTLISPPAGAVISANGVITWTPTEAQGPGVYTFTTVVTDTNSAATNTQQFSITNSFVVTVNEVNSAPIFNGTPANQIVLPLTPLTITNAATDSDIPANTLTYSLLSPPTGASISSAGVITWTPSKFQNDTTNLIRTVVTDNGSPPLSTTNTFTIIVDDDPVIVLNSATLAQEYCIATNNAIDPGETVTVLFSLQNVGLGSTTNLVVTMLQTNGIIPGAPQTYGVLPAGGGPVVQPFTFANTGTCGGTITAVLQLQDGAKNLGLISNTFTLGPLVTVLAQNFDGVTPPALPVGWTTSTTGAQLAWFTTNTVADTAPNAAFSTDANNTGINELDSPSIVLPNGPSQLSFRHSYAFEANSTVGTNGFDGGVLEIKIGNNAFTDITNSGCTFITNGYNRRIDPAFFNPLTNRWAWSGTNGGYVTTLVNLSPVAGQTIQLRWRVGTDNGNGGGGWRIDTVAITGYACCVDGAPVLTVQSNLTIPELTLLTVTNTATDATTPGSGLTYSLSNPPSGAVIDTNGIITWTPSEAQGPGVYTITTIVSDNAYPPQSATNSFNVTVTEVNVAPTLTVPADQTINELTTLNVSASATDPDIPANNLTFSLVSAPSGMTIDTNTGAISWTPTEAQGPSTNTVTVRVTDDGSPNLSDTKSFNVIVNEVNSAPVLTVPSDQTINELTTLNVSASATDPDIPANILTFSLVSAPAGMTINTNTGAISWTPTEAQGPSTNTVTVRVTDNGSPPLSDTKSFNVIVNKVNSAPVLTVPSDQTINELSTLNVSASATDSDVPTNTLTFSLMSAPSGMTINTNTGAMSWTPTEAQGPSTNTITVRVTDNGSPPLSDTKSFKVIVNEINTAPVLPSSTNYTINELTTLTVTNTATDSDIPANVLTYVLLAPPAHASIDTNGVITFTPDEGQGPGVYALTTVVTDNGTPNLSATNTITVTVDEVNSAPVLPPSTNCTINELTTLTVTNTATDSDIPANVLTYLLLAPPAHASIDTNGVIIFTPDEGQGPGVYALTTVVTDNGTPNLSATNTITVTVNEVNSAPVLPPSTNYTINELTTLTVTNTATDSDIPANVLSYALLAPPAHASIDTNGVVTFTPDEGQGPGVYTLTSVVTDNGTPNLSATNTITVTVNEVNSAPVLPPSTNYTINELTTLTITNTATDSDIPANVLSYALLAPPAHASIDTNGVITFSPDETQGPGVYALTTVVTDDGAPNLSATNTITVTVNEVNSAPVLPAQQNRTVNSGAAMVVTNTAADSDLPANQLSYTLLGPSGAVIDTNGIITWTAPSSNGLIADDFTTIVTDDGIPPLSATNHFTVTVIPPAGPPLILSLTLTNGVATVTWSSVSGHTYQLEYADMLTSTNWTAVVPTVPASGTTSSATNAVGSKLHRFYRVSLLP
jgi:hypothetical protein